MRQEKFSFVLKIEVGALRFDLTDDTHPGFFVCLSSFVTDDVANVRVSRIRCHDDRK